MNKALIFSLLAVVISIGVIFISVFAASQRKKGDR
jgi:hypothetical protein